MISDYLCDDCFTLFFSLPLSGKQMSDKIFIGQKMKISTFYPTNEKFLLDKISVGKKLSDKVVHFYIAFISLQIYRL